jgi:hypothetical protein
MHSIANFKKNLAVSIAMISVVELLTSCFLSPKLKPPTRINPDNVATGDGFTSGGFTVERNTDGTSAILRFETQVNSSCQVSSYDQQTSPDPLPQSLTWSDCSSAQPGRVFEETIKDLKPQALYVFAIKIWSSNSNRENAKFFNVKEDPSPGDPDSLFLMQADLITGFGQLRSLKFAGAASNLKDTLAKPAPCALSSKFQSGLPTENSDQLNLSRVSLRGNITASSEILASGQKFLVLNNGHFVSTASDMTLSYQATTGAGSVKFAKPSTIKEANLSQGSITQKINGNGLDDIDLAAPKIQSTDDLTVKWATNDTPTTVIITLTPTTTNKDGIICRADPKTAQTSIPKTLLAGLSKGRHMVSLRSETILTQGEKRWLMSTIDWKQTAVVVK